MNKKILITVAAATMMASVASASPLTDYSVGKTAVDLTWRNTQLSSPDLGDAGKKNNMDWGITTGLGNKWAVQYRQFDPKSKDSSYSEFGTTYTDNFQLKTQEFNVLYKIDKNVSAYAGIMKVKGAYNWSESGFGSGSDPIKSANKWQIGVVGTTKLAEKTTAYASVGTGKDLTTWGIGVGQELAPNVEFNVDYRSIKANKLEWNDGSHIDATAKGLGFGVTYKFK